MIKYIFLLIILISIQIKASPHTTTPTVESNNFNDFVWDDTDLIFDDNDFVGDNNDPIDG